MSKMSAGQLHLSWKDHIGTLVSVFENLLKKNTLVDCTLAAEGQYLKAHRVVLSACSSYFELLFSQESEKNPIVILKDVKFQELEAAVNFMYKGEVEVSEDRLAAFLEVAVCLQMRGLENVGKPQDSKKKVSPKKSSSPKFALTKRKQSRKEESNLQSYNADQISNASVDCEQIKNNECSSVHQSFERRSSPALVVSTLNVRSSCTERKDRLENNQQSLPLSSFNSSESIQCEENPIFKTEPETDTFLEEQSFEAERGFGNELTMMDDQHNSNEPNAENMDAVPTNQQDINDHNSSSTIVKEESGTSASRKQEAVSCGISASGDDVDLSTRMSAVSTDNQNSSSMIMKEELETLASWNQQAVTYDASASRDSVELRIGTSAASTGADWIKSHDLDPLSMIVKEESDMSSSWNQEIVIHGVSVSGNGVEPSAGTSAASTRADSLSIEDSKQRTPVSPEFSFPVPGSSCSTASGKSAITSCQRTTTRPLSKKFICPSCKALFMRLIDLKSHICAQICGSLPRVPEGKLSPNTPALRQRKKSQGRNRKTSKVTSLKCSECDYVTSRPSQLTTHFRSHTGERPFKCVHCDNSFGRKSTLEQHLKTHMSEKAFKCPHCDYSCRRKDHMVLHLEAHEGEKRFKCSHCHYASGHKSSLLQHLMTHTGQKPFKCPHCDHASRYKSDLVLHLRTHTREKPVKCPHCDFSCRQKKSFGSAP